MQSANHLAIAKLLYIPATVQNASARTRAFSLDAHMRMQMGCSCIPCNTSLV